jgi:hypothetical protein
MKTKRQIILILLGTLVASPALAQKNKTDIPPAITTPNSVETRLGTLKFFDGMPAVA